MLKVENGLAPDGLTLGSWFLTAGISCKDKENYFSGKRPAASIATLLPLNLTTLSRASRQAFLHRRMPS
jgi:hypothetical protein